MYLVTIHPRWKLLIDWISPSVINNQLIDWNFYLEFHILLNFSKTIKYFFLGGGPKRFFMVTWFGRYNYSMWGPNFHCFYSMTHGFRDIHTLHIFPISNQSIDFWSMKDWCNEHCIRQAWPSGIYLCSCKISKQNIR